MKRICTILALFLFLISCSNSLNNRIKTDLSELEEAIAMRPVVEVQKREIIDSLYHIASVDSNPYFAYKKLYEEYSSYNYDTALFYVQFMEQEATQEQMDEVQLCRAFVYMSGGLFKESADILENWDSSDSTLLIPYYINYVRLLWDLADNAGGDIGQRYNEEGILQNRQLQTLISPSDTMMYWYNRAVLDLREGYFQRSIERCHKSLSATPPSVHYQAIVSSTLASLYRLIGDSENALHYYIDAAICDIQSATYETVALRNIAELLFESGETQLAYQYIHIAMQDAKRYHARHREVSIAQSLPIIEEQMLSKIRIQQRWAMLLLIIVVLLLIFGIVGIIVLGRKNTALHSARQTIDRMNLSLAEANKLKEELLGTLLTSRSQYINAVRQYQHSVKQLASKRQVSELATIPKSADARLQRAVLDHQIDTVLLSIYPTFVHDFKSLLRNEELSLKKDELLNAQMRIFALIRLGVTHNEIIAEILDYSVNTVYNYKTRIIASSGLTQEEFYRKLMNIPSFAR